MIKKLAIGMALSLSIVTTVHATPTAGYVNQTYDTGYENPTQFIFENNDIWKPEKSPEVKSEETFQDPGPLIIVPYWEISDDERYLLKRCIMAECGYDQPDTGVRLAVDCILNRIHSAYFPNSVMGVISQPYQFSTYWDGRISSTWDISEQVNRIVDEELMSGSSYPGVLYFTAGCYNEYCTPWMKVGDHYFGY